MSQELLNSLEYIEKEKGVSREVLLDALKHALISACRKTYSDPEGDYDVTIDPETLRIQVLKEGSELNDPNFGRIAAQTAKQVIIQKIREAERESIFEEYTAKSGDIVTGNVHRVEKRAVIVDFGKTEGILPAREQSPADQFRQGNVLRGFVVEVKKTTKGPEIILSRNHPEFVSKLFEMEVPEIADKVVQIKGVAREAGSRTKIAVYSSDSKVDCVGSCVGLRGQRVKNIVRELGGEKIDIVPYDENIEVFTKNAMAPAEIDSMTFDEANKTAEIIVKDDQLSLAIGKRGQNIRLASKLLGWSLDVRSETQKRDIETITELDEADRKLLADAGLKTVKDVADKGEEGLAEVEGVDAEKAKAILAVMQSLLRPKTDEEVAESAEPAAEESVTEETPAAEAAAESDEDKPEENEEEKPSS